MSYTHKPVYITLPLRRGRARVGVKGLSPKSILFPLPFVPSHQGEGRIFLDVNFIFRLLISLYFEKICLILDQVFKKKPPD